VPTRRYSRYAMMTHLPHVDMMAEAVEVVESVLLLFGLCFMSFCQANQKHYVYVWDKKDG
jgi:hypothetical protein